MMLVAQHYIFVKQFYWQHIFCSTNKNTTLKSKIVLFKQKTKVFKCFTWENIFINKKILFIKIIETPFYLVSFKHQK